MGRSRSLVPMLVRQSPLVPVEEFGIRVVRIQRKKRTADTDPLQAGVGMSFERGSDGYHTVIHLLPGGSALESGKVFQGDRLLSVDGVPLRGLTVQDVSDMVLGMEGSYVAFTLETMAQQPTGSWEVSVQSADTPFAEISFTTKDAPQSPLTIEELPVPGIEDEGMSDYSSPAKLTALGYPTQDRDVAIGMETFGEDDGPFLVGMVFSPPPQCTVMATDRLMDINHRLQGEDYYENYDIRKGDTVLAIDGKMLQNQTSQELTEMLSGPLHSVVNIMLQNTSAEGDEMFKASLVRTMPLREYSHWNDYVNCPAELSSVHLKSPVGSPSVRLSSPVEAPSILPSVFPSSTQSQIPALDKEVGSEDSVIQKQLSVTGVEQEQAKCEHAFLPKETSALTMKFIVKVLEADGVAIGQDGTVFCVANLRLIFPDEASDRVADTVQASIPGQKTPFDSKQLVYDVKVNPTFNPCGRSVGRCMRV